MLPDTELCSPDMASRQANVARVLVLIKETTPAIVVLIYCVLFNVHDMCTIRIHREQEVRR